MNDLKIVPQFEDNSLLNRTQCKVLSKLSSHFKISQKLMRASVDKERAKENVLSFPMLRDVFSDALYPINYNIKLPELLDTRKFEKSLLYETWINIPSDVRVTPVSKENVWILVPEGEGRGMSGIYLNHLDTGGYYLLWLSSYLHATYPPPPG